MSGLILHEEHIELLSEDFKALKRELEGKTLQEGTLHFTGGRPVAGILCVWILSVRISIQRSILDAFSFLLQSAKAWVRWWPDPTVKEPHGLCCVLCPRWPSQAHLWFPSLQRRRSPHLAGGVVWTSLCDGSDSGGGSREKLL